jgi:hypothetical protein
MKQTRKRARRAPSPVWACAHERLEERLLLSGSSAVTAATAPIVIATVGAAAPFATPSGLFVGTPGGGDIGGTSSAPQSTPQTIDLGGGDLASSSGAGSSSLPPSPVGVVLGPTIGPSAPVGPQSGPAASAPTLIGDPIGPRSDGIESTVLEPMEAYYFSYSPVEGAAMGILPTSGRLGCASMASIVGEWGVEVIDLADPPGVPQPTAEPPSPGPPAPVAEAAEDGAAGPGAAVEGEAPRAPAATGAPTPEATTPAEDPPAPIAAGLRLSAPPVDVADWDDALGRLVEGVDDLAAGLHDLGASPATSPWVVAAGLMLVASEAARRARPRPRLAAAFVDGSASVVDPADDLSDRPRALGSSVRRLVALGLSRWTTRR